jgi:hypothetical protein
MTEFPPLKLDDAFVRLLKEHIDIHGPTYLSDFIGDGIAPLVGPVKATHITFKTVDSNGKVQSCIGKLCSKETCTCGYYDQLENK